MNQETIATNCPHCGTIVEFVSPDLNRKVKRVRANVEEKWEGEVKTRAACPNCRQRIYLGWIFTDSKRFGSYDFFHAPD